MNFKDIKFSKLFSEKHGDSLFSQIAASIKSEKPDECNDEYIETIFKVAFMSYFGLNDEALNRMLQDINCSTNIENIKKIHKNSIKFIQENIENMNIT